MPQLEDLRKRRRDKDDGDNSAKPDFVQATTKSKATEKTASQTELILTLENCADFLKVEDVIAELAEEALVEARAASGPDWSDTTVGDLLRRLVTLGGERGDQYGLPDAILPTANAQRRLAEALQKRRLILPELEERLRLVHESILRHWDKAKEWLKTEKPLLNDVIIIQSNAREWDERENRRTDFLLGFGLNDIDRAAKVLSLWYDLLTEEAVLVHSESKALLRDYAIELLKAHPTPSRIVEQTPKKPTHMMIVAAYGRADIVEAYLKRDPESVHIMRSDKRTAISWPCFTGNMEILEMFIAKGANIDHEDEDGWRPIHFATAGDSTSCAEKLLSCGASIEQNNVPRYTSPLHLAAQNGNVALVSLLCTEYNVDPSILNENKWTPLHLAAANDRSGVVTALKSVDAQLEATLDYGYTALHLAARDGSLAAVGALINAGADISARLKSKNPRS